MVVDATTFDSWTCELCQNDKSLEASLVSSISRLSNHSYLIGHKKHDCLLCPRTRRDPKKKSLYPPPDTYLRACKPTEGQGWVHILCSVFIPEVTYTDATRLRRVEAISTIPSYRWMNVSSTFSLKHFKANKFTDEEMHAVRLFWWSSRPLQRLSSRVPCFMRMEGRP